MSQSQEVQQKLLQLKTYIPFVERMISKLESRAAADKGEHLNKLKSLYKFLINPDSRVQNVEMLERMEKIIKGMYKSAGKSSSNTSHSSKSFGDERQRSDREKRDSGGHSHKNRDISRERMDGRSERPHHRDYHSSRKDRRSRSKERDQQRSKEHRDDRIKSSYHDSHRSSDSSDKNSNRSSYRESRPKTFEKQDDITYLSEKGHKVNESSSLKEKEKRLFGEDESSREGRNSLPLASKDQIKMHSLLDLPMPPVHQESLSTSSRLNTIPYLSSVDAARKESVNERAPISSHSSPKDLSHAFSNMDIIKKRLGMTENKTKYNFHEFKFDQSSLDPINTNESSHSTVFPAYQSGTKQSSSDISKDHSNFSRQESQSPGFSSNLPTSSRLPIKGSNIPLSSKSPAESSGNFRPSSSGLSPSITQRATKPDGNFPQNISASTNSRSLIHPNTSSSIHPNTSSSMSFSNNNKNNANEPIGSFLSQNANTNIVYPIQDRYSSGSDQRSITSSLKPTDIPLPSYPHASHEIETPQSPENEAAFSPDLSEDGAVKTIPLETEESGGLSEEKCLPSVNMDAIQKALNFINSHDKRPESKKVSYRYEDFVGPPNPSTSDYYDPEESWQQVSQEQLGSKDVDLRSKDVDLRQIPGQFIPPQPLTNSQFLNKRSQLTDTRLPLNTDNYSVNTSMGSDSNWYAQDTRRGSASSPKESMDVDMRSLMCGSQQNVSYSTIPSPKYPSNVQTSTELKGSNEKSKSVLKPELHNASRKSESSKLDSVRNRIAHDPDKLIKLGQKGVAASQLENYKQRREKYSMPIKPVPPRRSSDASDIANTTSMNKKSISVLDELLPETEEEKGKDADNFIQKDSTISKLLPSKPEVNRPDITKLNSPCDANQKSKTYNIKKPNLPEGASVSSTSKRGESFQAALQREHNPSFVSRPSGSSLAKASPTVVSDNSKSLRIDQLPTDRRSKPKDNVSRDINSDASNKISTPDMIRKIPTPDSTNRIARPRIPSNDSEVDISIGSNDFLPDPKIDSSRTSKINSSLKIRDDSFQEKSTSRDPRSDGLRDNVVDPTRDHRPDAFRDSRTDIRDPRANNFRDPRSDIRHNSKKEIVRGPRPLLSDPHNPKIIHPALDPRFKNLNRDPRSDILANDPRTDKRPLINSLLPFPPKRDPRLTVDSRSPRANIPPSNIQRDPRMAPVRHGFQPPQPQFNLDKRWNPVGGVQRLPFPAQPGAQVPSINSGIIQPPPGVAPQNSAIGQTFTCVMMQGLPHYANSSHIYRFFEEYLLRDLCIELTESYECKGTAFIHFPTHVSAKEALEKENGKMMGGYKIYLRICSVGILRQAKNTNGVQNFDREKYLNIPQKPKGPGNPYYKPKPKAPPPVSKPPPVHVVNPVPINEPEQEETSKQGYSNLCGVKVDPKGSKNLQNFKIPKLKKSISQEESPPEHKKIPEDNMEKSVPSNSDLDISLEEIQFENESKRKSENKAKSIKIHENKLVKGRTIRDSSSSSEREVVTRNNSPTSKKNRRYHKIIPSVDSDSESEKEEFVPAKKSPTRNKSQSKLRTNIETDDSEDESSLTIDESAPVSSDKGSDSSDIESLEKEVRPLDKRKTGTAVRGRPKGSGIKQPMSRTRKPLEPPKKIISVTVPKKRGRKRQISRSDTDLLKAKITRLKHVEFKEILSPKKKLQVLIPVPSKLVFSTFSEDKLPKRVPKKSVARTASPTPSETLSDALSTTSTSVTNIHDLSEVGESSQKLTDTQDSFDILVSDADVKPTVESTEPQKRSILPEATRASKIRKTKHFSWQKGYLKKKSVTVPDIFVNHMTNRKRSSSYVSYKPSKRMKIAQEEKAMQSSITDHTSVFYGVLDDNDLPDITQITPSITDNLLPELSSIESVIRADMDMFEKEPRPLVTSEKAKERIKMISNDLLETANKFTEKESRERRSGDLLPAIFNNEERKESEPLGIEEEEEEVNLSLKVDQLVESLDSSISSVTNMFQQQQPDQFSSCVEPSGSSFSLNYAKKNTGSDIPSKDPVDSSASSEVNVDSHAVNESLRNKNKNLPINEIEKSKISSAERDKICKDNGVELQTNTLIEDQNKVHVELYQTRVKENENAIFNEIEKSKISSKDSEDICKSSEVEGQTNTSIENQKTASIELDHTCVVASKNIDDKVVADISATTVAGIVSDVNKEKKNEVAYNLKEHEIQTNTSESCIVKDSESKPKKDIIQINISTDNIEVGSKTTVDEISTITDDDSVSNINKKDKSEVEHNLKDHKVQVITSDDRRKSESKSKRDIIEIDISTDSIEIDRKTTEDKNQMNIFNDKNEIEKKFKEDSNEEATQKDITHLDSNSKIDEISSSCNIETGNEKIPIKDSAIKQNIPCIEKNTKNIVTSNNKNKEIYTIGSNNSIDANTSNEIVQIVDGTLDNSISETTKNTESSMSVSEIFCTENKVPLESCIVKDSEVKLNVAKDVTNDQSDVCSQVDDNVASLKDKEERMESSTSEREETSVILLQECSEKEKPFIDSQSSITDTGVESDADDGASIGLSSVCSIPDDNSIVSSEGREPWTPELTVPSGGKKSRREKATLSSNLMERRRITRGSLVVPQVAETILWDDGGIVDLFQCDQCDYVGKQRVSHIINFHQERKVPCEFRREDYTPVLRDSLGPVYPVTTKRTSLDLSWIPKQKIFDREIECKDKNCDYTSNSRFDLIYHLLEHTPEAVSSIFHCRLCNFMSDNLTHFYDHVSSHTGEYRHTCDRCGQKGFSVEALILHHKDYHGSQSQEIRSDPMVLEDNFPYIHVCRSCHHVQIRLRKMEDHIQYKHNGKADYIKANMSRHLTLHNEKKKEQESSILIKKNEGGETSDLSISKPKIVKKILRGKGKKKRFNRKKGKKKKKEEKVNKVDLKIKNYKELRMEIGNESETSEKSTPNEDNREMEVNTTRKKNKEIEVKKENLRMEKKCRQLKIKIGMNVPVFLGNEKEISEKEEGEKEKGVEELVNRILLNNYTSKSKSEIKKKISNLDDILKKVDDSFIDMDEGNSGDIGFSFKPDINIENARFQSPSGNDSGSSANLPTDMNSNNMSTDQNRDDIGISLNKLMTEDLTSKDTNITTSEEKLSTVRFDADASQPSTPHKAKKSPFLLTGLISRLKGNLSKEDVLEKIKERDFVQNKDFPSDNEYESGSENNLVICEEEQPSSHHEDEDSASGFLAVAQKPGLLRVKPPEQLFPPKQEPEAREEIFNCRISACCTLTSSLHELRVHSWTQHQMYICTIADCNFCVKMEEIYNYHILETHKVKNFYCPFKCKFTIKSPSELIRHVSQEHSFESLPSLRNRINSEGSRMSTSIHTSAVPVRDPSSGIFQIPSTVKAESSGVPLLIPKEEKPFFPAEETLPSQPPTVPLLSLFLRFQSQRAFTTFTMSKASEVFKCMFVGCTFCTEEPKAFEMHSDKHFTSDYRCCYCLIRMPSGRKLVEHVLEEHSHCSFQCKYCLYRAYTKIYLGVHLRKFHPEREPRYIKVGTLRSEPPPNPAIEKFVHPYYCTAGQCNFRSVDTDAFKSHLHAVHGLNVEVKCYFCERFYNSQGMIEHMKAHMMNEYQCPYCLCGESEREKLLTHLLNCHPGRPGKVLLRRQVSGGSSSSGHKPSVAPYPSTIATTTTATTTITTTTVISSVSVTSTITSARSNLSSNVASPSASSPSHIGIQGPRLLTEKIRMPVQVSSSGFGTSSPVVAKESSLEQTGLTGVALYRCGNEKCEYCCATQRELKEHLQVCDFSRDSPQLKCYHCAKIFRHLSGLLDHIKVHGPKRYSCGVEGCDYRGTMQHYFKNHMKQVHHHTSFKAVVKNFVNKDPETQEYIVYPKDMASTFKEPHKKRRNEFGVDDLDKIPRPHISYNDLKCYHCTYCSKIRLNLIKHLNLHKNYPNGIPSASVLQDGVKSIPTKQPINPVPRLERKELMFDKMMNLAGSSFEDKRKIEQNELRTKHPIPQEELDNFPAYIPDEKVNSCGIDGCKYLSCDETMLKYHIRTLHSEVEYFTCPHCTNVLLAIDQIGAHLKLHGETLYRCGWCVFLTPRKALVERHLKEKHPTKYFFDFCVRGTEGDKEESDSKEDGSSPLYSSGSIIGANNQEPLWQCGNCPFKSVVQNEMVNHTNLKHGIKSQYKCGYCQVRSSVRTAFDDHFAAKHPDKQFRVLCMYYRLDSDDIEPLPPGGSTTSHEPLWRRNDPDRKKQIRGILLEDDIEEKETSIFDIQPGNPRGDEFVCPKCVSFKTPCVNTFRSHLCKEANYQRFECAECGITSPLLPNLRRHYTKTHGSQFTADCYINLPIESTSEAWVESIISHQQHMIKLWKVEGGGFASPSKTSNRRSSNQSDIEEASGIVLHDSGSDKTKYTCSICLVECRTASGLKSHTTAMHQAKFKCQYCPYSSNTELGVSNHRSQKHPKLESYDANKLTAVTPKTDPDVLLPEETKRGSVKKGGSSKLGCPHCDFIAPTQRALYAHKSTVHIQYRNYLCEYCGLRFCTSRDANRHSSFKHGTLPANVTFSPLEKEEIKDAEVADEKPESKKPADVSSDEKPFTVLYSCCHCSVKGPYNFAEEHVKAQHRDLPFLLRKEEEKAMYLEVYNYRCGHCATDSVSLMEAMDHWVKNHVTLDFKFSLCLFTSTVIKIDTPSVPSTSHEVKHAAVNKSILSSSKSKKSAETKPDSSIQSDFEETAEEEMNSSFSSSIIGGETDSELDQQVSSSTSEQDLFTKCGYCRKISKSKAAIIEHINVIHKDKPIKVSSYHKEDYRRSKKVESDVENKKLSPSKRAPRGLPKDRICFRCDICSHVVKVRKSIKAHMKRVHPEDTSAFTRIQFESDVRPPTKQPIKCNYCGDTSATIEEMKSHHTFLHSHLDVSFTNLRDEALSSIHKSSSSSVQQNVEGLTSSSSSLGAASRPRLSEDSPRVESKDSCSFIGTKPPFIGAKRPFFKNTARKSFPLKILKKKQIATKSTSGRLQLVRLFKPSDIEDENDGVDKNESFTSSESVERPREEGEAKKSLNFNEIYAFMNLIGNAPMRLSVTQISEFLNLNPKVVIKRTSKERLQRP